ncbi:MAG: hypothetical protein A2Z91_02360 [Deltaproteobacteria bacterium GWA2_38_16]|nr:MAG: hypothetical protein A2Z91_02360 [Deltaproteobacteria bacterium GWA2_38_16]OGQ02039.1 MAG: hypothetical protein A3D19_08655 [Deltaproteobacteria bacterium RIFCSPHIGHO2_02_FULL_38_15]OGQ33304.1 MAG: hypothetical protein A3A72_07260 [Deltaproteobacteria bacterium RIFCSPLOWO2_01_FULL_38_9]HBQ21573.1 hypothetical protein [Deltaproteobacteria bacterium]
MKRYLFIIFFLLSAPSFSALVPEDGSMHVHGWVHSVVKTTWPKVQYEYSGIQDIDLLKEIFQSEGLILKTVEVETRLRQWFQDHLLFNDRGEFLQMAPIEYKILLDYPPSLSTFYTLDDRDVYNPFWIKNLAHKLGRPVKELNVTRVEGGELISGRREGKPYALIDENVIRRAQAQFKFSFDEAKRQVAQDLEVEEENLLSLSIGEDFPTHIDTWMMALPNGKILIQKDSRFQAVIQKIKESGFAVVEVSGEIKDVNFFNGFVVRSRKDNQLIVFTNKSQNESLNYSWEKVLQAQGVVRVYFLGKWHPDAGIDCAGALF